ncbi:MAG: polysaccharide deacetylase family protein [Eubacteriales bacterium]|nr:polysaccharide deacetylase family protein [Eubacteriales bacterium]
MSLFSNKKMRIIFIYCGIIILLICGVIAARHKKSSAQESSANTSTSTDELSGLPDNSGISDKSNTQNNSNLSQSSSDSDRKPPFDSSNQGNGIGGGAIMGNCSIGSRKLPIYCVDLSKKANLDTSKKYVSISFDAAWGDEDTIKILDILDKYNVKTTFFMTGGWVDSYPDKVLEIYNRGHDLGNHSQNHKEMSKLSVSEQKEEIMSVANKIKEITGYTSFLFRPPYGDYNSTLIDTVYGCNFYPIEWDVDSLDWKDYGTDNIIKTVTTHKALKNGSIILMHNGAKYTAEALESVITGLQSQGYEIVPISQLINTENFHMDGTGLQIPD